MSPLAAFDLFTRRLGGQALGISSIDVLPTFFTDNNVPMYDIQQRFSWIIRLTHYSIPILLCGAGFTTIDKVRKSRIALLYALESKKLSPVYVGHPNKYISYSEKLDEVSATLQEFNLLPTDRLPIPGTTSRILTIHVWTESAETVFLYHGEYLDGNLNSLWKPIDNSIALLKDHYQDSNLSDRLSEK
jgi:hypothetical protein